MTHFAELVDSCTFCIFHISVYEHHTQQASLNMRSAAHFCPCRAPGLPDCGVNISTPSGHVTPSVSQSFARYFCGGQNKRQIHVANITEQMSRRPAGKQQTYNYSFYLHLSLRIITIVKHSQFRVMVLSFSSETKGRSQSMWRKDKVELLQMEHRKRTKTKKCKRPVPKVNLFHLCTLMKELYYCLVTEAKKERGHKWGQCHKIKVTQRQYSVDSLDQNVMFTDWEVRIERVWDT